MPAISKKETRLKLQFVANTDHSIARRTRGRRGDGPAVRSVAQGAVTFLPGPARGPEARFSPEVIVGQLLYALCSGGGCRSDSEALNDDPLARELPEVADARSLEEKLRYAAAQGAFLVLSVEPQWIGRARLTEAWLSNRHRATEKHITTGMADTL